MSRPPRRFFGRRSKASTMLPGRSLWMAMPRLTAGAGAESRWLAARRDEAAVVEVLEQSDRAGPSGRETANRHDAGLQGLRDRGDYDRRYRIIPRLVDQDPWAQLRRPMDMIRQG